MPVVAVINSRVFLYSITSGGHTFKCLRIDFKLRALNRGARNLLLTLRCSVRETKLSTLLIESVVCITGFLIQLAKYT